MRGAAALGSLATIGGTRTAAASVPPRSAGTSHVLTSPDYFNLATVTTASFQATSFLTGLKTSQTYYQVQGLAIDSHTNCFYVAQAPNPNRLTLTMALGGSTWSADAYDQHSSGDLVISRFDLTNGAFLDSMYLLGAGHGGQLAIESGSPHPSIWSEAYPSNPKTTGNPPVASGEVYGTKLARLPYIAGKLMTNTEVAAKKYNPNPYVVTRYGAVAGAHEYNAAIDSSSASLGTTGVLVVRYRLGSDPPGAPRRFAAFDLAAASNGDFSTALGVAMEPTEIVTNGAHSEGFATCGQFIYLVGTDGNGVNWLYQVDFNGAPGSYLAKVQLPGSGEPESIALYAPNGSPSRLYYLNAGTTHPRTFDLYSLNT